MEFLFAACLLVVLALSALVGVEIRYRRRRTWVMRLLAQGPATLAELADRSEIAGGPNIRNDYGLVHSLAANGSIERHRQEIDANGKKSTVYVFNLKVTKS